MGIAACSSSRDSSPVKKKSFTAPMPVLCAQKVSAKASAICVDNSCAIPVALVPSLGFGFQASRCVGTGKSGRLNGTCAKPLINFSLLRTVLAFAPFKTIATSAVEERHKALNTSPINSLPKSLGQSSDAFRASSKDFTSSSQSCELGDALLAAALTNASYALPRSCVDMLSSSALVPEDEAVCSVSLARLSSIPSRRRRSKFCIRRFSQYSSRCIRGLPSSCRSFFLPLEEVLVESTTKAFSKKLPMASRGGGAMTSFSALDS
mmetsp:Transcript_30576/g.55844  ORF Transcript_30576/g.55844 Transcript_30576/m.55844 type:complete len:264 (-) Transcript_30576:1104-1895(-)